MTETFGEMLERMRGTLKPKGLSPLVRLQLRNCGFVQEHQVTQAINALESKVMTQQELNGLEKLGLMLLVDSAPSEG